jgi:hypothetical protein
MVFSLTWPSYHRAGLPLPRTMDVTTFPSVPYRICNWTACQPFPEGRLLQRAGLVNKTVIGMRFART